MCQEKSFTIQENIPYLKLHPYNQTYMHDNFNIYRYNKASKMWSYCGSTYYRLVGFTLSQATKALRESRGIALLYF